MSKIIKYILQDLYTNLSHHFPWARITMNWLTFPFLLLLAYVFQEHEFIAKFIGPVGLFNTIKSLSFIIWAFIGLFIVGFVSFAIMQTKKAFYFQEKYERIKDLLYLIEESEKTPLNLQDFNQQTKNILEKHKMLSSEELTHFFTEKTNMHPIIDFKVKVIKLIVHQLYLAKKQFNEKTH